MNLKAFYNVLRKHGVKLTTGNIQGFDHIVAQGAIHEIPLHQLAYILATAYHETAYTMQPIKEYGGIRYYRRMYDIQGRRPKVAMILGNIHPGDGVKFAGRGFVQLTGRKNYEVAGDMLDLDLINNPDQVMKLEVATQILIQGMKQGWFTGKKLSDYIDKINESDKADGKEYTKARQIINGTDQAAKIARHALMFEEALRAGGYTGLPPKTDGGMSSAPPETTIQSRINDAFTVRPVSFNPSVGGSIAETEGTAFMGLLLNFLTLVAKGLFK